VVFGTVRSHNAVRLLRQFADAHRIFLEIEYSDDDHALPVSMMTTADQDHTLRLPY
jgi:hypothetical protein